MQARLIGVLPLVLLFVELLQIRKRVSVRWIEVQDFLECLERAIDETPASEIQPEAEQDVRVFERRQARPLQ